MERAEFWNCFKCLLRNVAFLTLAKSFFRFWHFRINCTAPSCCQRLPFHLCITSRAEGYTAYVAWFGRYVHNGTDEGFVVGREGGNEGSLHILLSWFPSSHLALCLFPLSIPLCTTGRSPIDLAITSGFKELAAMIAMWSCMELRAKVQYRTQCLFYIFFWFIL
jgi:hypothetical protein